LLSGGFQLLSLELAKLLLFWMIEGKNQKKLEKFFLKRLKTRYRCAFVVENIIENNISKAAR
jgi:hypothetical protein